MYGLRDFILHHEIERIFQKTDMINLHYFAHVVN